MHPLLPLVLSVVPGDPLSAEDPPPPETVWEALLGGKTWFHFRYRFEVVDDDDPTRPDKGYASTLRSVLGYETAPWHGFSALLEFEDVTVVGNKNAYDDTLNGETSRGVVADPPSTEVNQVFLRWAWESQGAELGRQRLILDNHRFVGNVGWRQNEQTFDAATWHGTFGGVELLYSLVLNVNRVFGDDSPVGDFHGESHLLHAATEVPWLGRATVYAYLLDLENADAFSTFTFGGRIVGEHPVAEELDLLWEGEVADQTDHADNPNDVSALYYHAVAGARTHGVTAKLGIESLGGGDPGAGDKFTTPLATLHAFNGWADQFLTTPDAGLEDWYASLGGKAGGVDLLATYHVFEPESGSGDYGSEIDVSAGYQLHEHVKVGLKYASYFEDGFDDDIQKFWVWTTFF